MSKEAVGYVLAAATLVGGGLYGLKAWRDKKNGKTATRAHVVGRAVSKPTPTNVGQRPTVTSGAQKQTVAKSTDWTLNKVGLSDKTATEKPKETIGDLLGKTQREERSEQENRELDEALELYRERCALVDELTQRLKDEDMSDEDMLKLESELETAYVLATAVSDAIRIKYPNLAVNVEEVLKGDSK